MASAAAGDCSDEDSTPDRRKGKGGKRHGRGKRKGDDTSSSSDDSSESSDVETTALEGTRRVRQSDSDWSAFHDDDTDSSASGL